MRFAPEVQDQMSPFEVEAVELLKNLREFRAWIDQEKRKKVRFMRAYKNKLERMMGPSVDEFRKRYENTKEGKSPLFRHLLKIFTVLSRPIKFMETDLRPSVGMGVLLERWMMTSAVEDYLRECCQEVDRHLRELEREIDIASVVGRKQGS